MCASNVPTLNKLQIQSVGFFIHSLNEILEFALCQAPLLGKDSERHLLSEVAILNTGELVTVCLPKSYCHWRVKHEGTVKHLSSKKEFHFDFMTDLMLRNARNILTLGFNESVHFTQIYHLFSSCLFLSLPHG